MWPQRGESGMRAFDCIECIADAASIRELERDARVSGTLTRLREKQHGDVQAKWTLLTPGSYPVAMDERIAGQSETPTPPAREPEPPWEPSPPFTPLPVPPREPAGARGLFAWLWIVGLA